MPRRPSGPAAAFSVAALLTLLLAASPELRSAVLSRSRGPAAGSSATPSYTDRTWESNNAGLKRFENEDYSDLIVVTEDRGLDIDGCEAISVFSLSDRTALFRGDSLASPGRIAASPDLSTIVAVYSNHSGNPELAGTAPFLYLVTSDASAFAWSYRGPIYHHALASNGGLAITLDGASLLTTEVFAHAEPFEMSPFHIRRYRLDSLRGGELGEPVAERSHVGLVVEILPDLDGRRVHTFQTTGLVRTFDARTLEELAPPIQARPLVHELGEPISRIRGGVGHATLSTNGRYLVTNRWESPELNVVDLVDREAWVVDVAGVKRIGGVAWSHGPSHPDLLAIHAIDEIIIAELDPTTGLHEHLRFAVEPPDNLPFNHTAKIGPVASLAWSGDGASLIVATSRGTADFAVVDLSASVEDVRIDWYLTACSGDWNAPNDIFTINSLRSPTDAPAVSTPTSTPPPPLNPATPTAVPSKHLLHLPRLQAMHRFPRVLLGLDEIAPVAAPAGSSGSGKTSIDSSKATRTSVPNKCTMRRHQACEPMEVRRHARTGRGLNSPATTQGRVGLLGSARHDPRAPEELLRRHQDRRDGQGAPGARRRRARRQCPA